MRKMMILLAAMVVATGQGWACQKKTQTDNPVVVSVSDGANAAKNEEGRAKNEVNNASGKGSEGKDAARSEKVNVEREVLCVVMDSANTLIGQAVLSKLKMENGKWEMNKDSVITRWDGCAKVMLRGDSTMLRVSAAGFHTKDTCISINQESPVVIVYLRRDGSQEILQYGSYKGVGLTGRKYKGEVADGAAAERVYYSMATTTMAAGTMATTTTADGAAMPKYEGASAEADIAMPAVMEESFEATMDIADSKMVSGVNAPSAGKLTAGEVNDFAKWALWDNILSDSHKRYVDDWKMVAKERYTVQVVGRNNYPIAGRMVSLVSQQGTVYQACTDNAGRAELWNGLTSKREEGKLSVVVDGKRYSLGKGITTIRLDEACEASETAEVMFVMDATGSMGDELRYLTAELQDVIARSEHAVEGLTIRTGALVYRDHGDEYLTRISRLSNEIKTTQDFLNKQHAGGGGDYEEAVPEALMATINAAGWSEDVRTKIAFLILDAPCHQDSTTIAMLHEQVLTAAANGIRIVPVVCSGLGESGELLMRTIALATNGTSFFLTDDSGIGNSHLKPTTDTLKVEHLNDMLVRTIIEFCRMPQCEVAEDVEEEEIDQFVPNPTDAPASRRNDMVTVRPNPCHGICRIELSDEAEMVCLVDASGKAIVSLGKQEAGSVEIRVGGLATGVYFVKALIGGQWCTAKAVVV